MSMRDVPPFAGLEQGDLVGEGVVVLVRPGLEARDIPRKPRQETEVNRLPVTPT